MNLKNLLQRMTICFSLAAAICISAGAESRIVTTDLPFQFCSADFTGGSEEDGVFIMAVPSADVAVIRYGNRAIQAGDALPVDALDHLTMETNCVTEQNVVLSYYTVSKGKTTSAKEMKLSILPKKNEPPAADAGTMETYKNIPNSGKLNGSDPEGGMLTYQLAKAPKRGTVEIETDGSYTYTPYENKVGKDSFTYTVTDEAGNVSDPAKISITIKKPTDKATYADMYGDPDAYAAMWMKDRGLYAGSVIADHLCFGPEDPVTRGEFLVMAMKLVEAAPDDSVITSGFADDAAAPVWMQPYIAAAVSNGMISGTAEAEGVVFRPVDPLTDAEAAVMLQNILQLPVPDASPVFADETPHPVWAQSAAAALAQADIRVAADPDEPIISRREAAGLLLQIEQYLNRAEPTFYWMQ